MALLINNDTEMKKIFFPVAIVLLLLVGCKAPVEKVEYWMSYDDIALLASPTDTASVVKQLNGRVSPFNIEQRDSSGEWGLYVVSRGAFSKIVSGWLPLKEMIYAGSDDPEERMEAFVVKSKELPAYKHPKVNKRTAMSPFIRVIRYWLQPSRAVGYTCITPSLARPGVNGRTTAGCRHRSYRR